MSTAIAIHQARYGLRFRPWLLAWGAALTLSLLLYLAKDVWPAAWQYPREWQVPVHARVALRHAPDTKDAPVFTCSIDNREFLGSVVPPSHGSL